MITKWNPIHKPSLAVQERDDIVWFWDGHIVLVIEVVRPPQRSKLFIRSPNKYIQHKSSVPFQLIIHTTQAYKKIYITGTWKMEWRWGELDWMGGRSGTEEKAEEGGGGWECWGGASTSTSSSGREERLEVSMEMERLGGSEERRRRRDRLIAFKPVCVWFWWLIAFKFCSASNLSIQTSPPSMLLFLF